MRYWGPKEAAQEAATNGDQDTKGDRLPKKKVAVFFGYNGQGFKGSQINPGEKTIEGELWKAFISAGCISPDNADDYKKVSLARAARTDGGVHAAVNIVTLKLILAPSDKPVDQSTETWINSFLPETIRVWRIVRVQAGFEPRKACDQRNYEYSIPTHVFLGPKPGTPMSEWLDQSRSEYTSTNPEGRPLPACTEASRSVTSSFWSSQPEDSKFSDDLIAKRGWRITPEVLEAARAFVKAYEGSHNYHNYTVASVPDKDEPRGPGGRRPKKGGPQDASSNRVMRSLSVSDPFLVNDVEYVSVDFLGQSFMLHQIRKMIGFLILAVRTGTPPSLVQSTFLPPRIHIPKAPALGLLLLEPQYQEYNKRILEHNTKIESLDKLTVEQKADQRREPIGVQGKEADVLEFKRNEIYRVMWHVEAHEDVFPKWVNYVDVFEGHDFEYLNPNGTVPDRAVFKTGERTDQPRRAKKGDQGLEEGLEEEKEKVKGVEGQEETQEPSDDERSEGEEDGDE